jgi:hypothetical protein
MVKYAEMPVMTTINNMDFSLIIQAKQFSVSILQLPSFLNEKQVNVQLSFTRVARITQWSRDIKTIQPLHLTICLPVITVKNIKANVSRLVDYAEQSISSKFSIIPAWWQNMVVQIICRLIDHLDMLIIWVQNFLIAGN